MMKSLRFLVLFILIPIFGLSQNPDIEIESGVNIKFIEHNVKRKQTLFTISNLYNVPIDLIKKYNPKNIHALTVISAPEGINKIKENHPDITLVTASVDEKLDDNWYIVPGLGDMGDRLFGTT